MFRNPISVAGRIERCWLLSYRTPLEAVLPLLPRTVHPMEHGGFAFYNVVLSKLRHMRPAWSPFGWGLSYWHIAYRIYAYVRPIDGPLVEGLFFLRSDCNNLLVMWLGNLMTDFNFHYSLVYPQENGVDVINPTAPAALRVRRGEPALAEGSPFTSIAAAAELLKYKPCGISLESPLEASLVHITRDETQWIAHPCVVERAEFTAFRNMNATLELCTELEPIDYVWRRGAWCPLLG